MYCSRPSRPSRTSSSQLEEGRVVLQQMADHEPPVEALGELAQLLRLGDVERKRLLDEDVLAGLERRFASV